MKLDDVYKEWIPVKERQVKNSTLTTYQQIYMKKVVSYFWRYGSISIE